MLVTVEDGRATRVKGNPDQPVIAGFLCGKVSNYLDRVYHGDRLLHPLIRDGGSFRRASWDEALDLAAARLRKVVDELGGEAILPYSYGCGRSLRARARVERSRLVHLPGPGLGRRARRRARGPDGLVAGRLRRGRRRTGHDPQALSAAAAPIFNDNRVEMEATR